MEIGKKEAEAALKEIASVSEKTKRAISTGPAPEILMLWGIVWLFGNGSAQFAPQFVGVVWPVLAVVGSIGSSWLGIRHARRITNIDGTADPALKRIFWFWLVLFLYATVWIAILNPAGGERSGATIARQVGAFFTTIPMFAYVVGGLWFGRFYIWLGLGVTLVTLVGLFGFPGYFWIGMAVFGGGALLLSGLHMRRTWSQI